MFVKVFKRIHDSSIAQDHMMRLVFMDFLILADRDGVVDMTTDAIARRTNVPLETVRVMIERLCSPDPESNSPDQEGKRLMPLTDEKPWGWRIVNFEKYRNIRNSDELRAQTRARVQKFRDKHKKPDSESKPNPVVLEIPESLNTPAFVSAWSEWQEYRHHLKKPGDWDAMFRRQLRHLATFRVEQSIEAIQASMRQGWTGIFPEKLNSSPKTTPARIAP